MIKVPLLYAPKDKLLTRITQDPEIQKLSAIDLPRMAFEITSNVYDKSRNRTNLQKFVVKHPTEPNRMKYIYDGSPRNITFNLYIYTKTTEDMMKIVEQIYPFFKPEWTSSVQLVPELGITVDVPIEMNGGPTIEDKFDGEFKNRQSLIYTFSFTMRAWYYGPRYDKPIIKYVYENFYVSNRSDPDISPDEGDKVGYIKITPGLNANGEPTSNSAVSIPPDEIWVDDDFGFVTDVYDGIQVIGT